MGPTPEYRRRRRFVDYGIALLLSVIVLPLVYLIYCLFDTAPVVSSAEVKVLNPRIEAGDLLRLEWRITFERACPGVSHRRLRDGYFVDIPDLALTGEHPPASLGSPRVIRNAVQIPATLPPGEWAFEARPAYACNPVQRLFPLRERLPLAPFTIVAPTAARPPQS